MELSASKIPFALKGLPISVESDQGKVRSLYWLSSLTNHALPFTWRIRTNVPRRCSTRCFFLFPQVVIRWRNKRAWGILTLWLINPKDLELTWSEHFEGTWANLSGGFERSPASPSHSHHGCSCWNSSSDCSLHQETFWLQHLKTDNDLRKRVDERF